MLKTTMTMTTYFSQWHPVVQVLLTVVMMTRKTMTMTMTMWCMRLLVKDLTSHWRSQVKAQKQNWVCIHPHITVRYSPFIPRMPCKGMDFTNLCLLQKHPSYWICWQLSYPCVWMCGLPLQGEAWPRCSSLPWYRWCQVNKRSASAREDVLGWGSSQCCW